MLFLPLMLVRSLSCQIVAFLLFRGITAQNCATVADGCDAGKSHESGVRSAIARFKDGSYYGGGGDQIVMSSSVDGSALAVLTYLCQDGSTPPRLEGSIIRSSAEKILSCPNQCGGISAPNSDKCGFGILVASNAAGTSCFSKAVDVIPKGTAPTVVQSVNAFKNPACLFDAPSSRSLVNGSNVDYSSNGMTVEKCADLAGKEAWRYAGVEFGGECYWGDELFNAQQSNPADCSTACAGDTTEVCGGGNRILVYENTDWQLLTRPELADQCNQYLDVLSQLKIELDHWKDLILQYQDLLKSQAAGRKKVKRQETEIMRVFREARKTRDAILKRKVQLENLEKVLRAFFDVANRKARVKPTEIELLVRNIVEPVAQVGEGIAGPAAVITEVGAPAEAAVQVATAAIAVVGAPKVITGTGIIVATGIFAVLGALVESLLDTTKTEPSISTPQLTTIPPSTTTPNPTSRSSSTTSTTCSLCTACLDERYPYGNDLNTPDKRKRSFAPVPIPDKKDPILPKNVDPSAPEERDFTPLVRSALEKRRDLVRSYTVCNMPFDTTRIPYPHTHGEGDGDDPNLTVLCPGGTNPNGVADCIPAITKYLAFTFIQEAESRAHPAGIRTDFCGWRVTKDDGRVISEDETWQKYSTEHVLELHFLPTFLKWLTNPATWTAMGYGVTGMDCFKLQNILFTGGTQNWLIYQIQDAWSWHDLNTGQPPRLNEFFILENTINSQKTRVFNHLEDINAHNLGGSPTGTPSERMQRAHGRLRLTSLVFEYMNDDSVRNAFIAANNRIRTAWAFKMAAFFANPGNMQFDFNAAVRDDFRGADGFLKAWDLWLGQFLDAKSRAARSWRDAMLNELVAAAQQGEQGGASGILQDAIDFRDGQTIENNPANLNPLRKLTNEFLSLHGYPRAN